MSKCTKCGGTGRIPNPSYPDNLRALDRRYESGYLPYPHYEAELVNLYGSLERLPEEYIECPVCRGIGRKRFRAAELGSSRRAYHGS